MTREEIENAVVAVCEQLRPTEFIPNPLTRGKTSTGNMAFQAFGYVKTNREMLVYIDKSIAPYVPYTNEPWIAAFWGGRKNPNEGWWHRFVNEFAHRLAAELGGELEE